MPKPIRVVVWGENVHERRNPLVRQIYPQGMHNCIADGLREDRSFQIRTATLQEPQHGLTKSVLAETDVLIWWGHAAHGKVRDTVVARVLERIWQGMGFIALHSAHYSKVFNRLMGTTGSLVWREAGERERLWVCNPGHPIARGIDKCFEIEQTEMYGEPFAIPAPDEVVFISWFEGGEVFRSGCTWKRGNGKIFYFRPGHEVYPIYYHPIVRLVLRNAVSWAAPEGQEWIDRCPQISLKQTREKLVRRGPRLHRAGEKGFR